MSRIKFLRNSYDISLRRMQKDFTDDKLTLVQVSLP